MIPYALLRCAVTASSGGRLDLRVLELSDRHFTVRVSAEDQAILTQAASIRMSFFQQTSGDFLHVCISDFEISPRDTAAFWQTFQITPHSDAFANCARRFSEEYLHYIRLKLAGDDAALSAVFTGYPAEAEQVFCRDFQTQYRSWMENLHPPMDWLKSVQSAAEIAVWLDRPALWDAFLAQPFPDFFRKYASSLQLSAHPFSSLLPDTVYLGNQYCTHLMPDAGTLTRFLRKAESEGLRPVVVFPPIRESDFPRAAALLNLLAGRQNGSTELVINDWGTLFDLRQQYPGRFVLTAGSMLFRDTRDPRLAFQPALNAVRSAGLSEDHAAALQQEYGISAISLELAFLPENFTSMKRCLQLPFYQTNTSSYCPLAAIRLSGQRGRQEAMASCPQYCRDSVFLYPSFLNMCGIGNTLFGFSAEAMESCAPLEKALRPGTDRLVFLFPWEADHDGDHRRTRQH